jgi:transcriptional regulator with XRE-family HTH domain
MAAGMTQEVLAERAGLHATYVGMVERGVRNPTLDVAAQIAKALRVELPVLISESLAERSGRTRRG